nr:hypothetical protein [Haloarcula sp. CK38]
MSRPLGYLSVVLSLCCVLGVGLVARFGVDGTVAGFELAYLLGEGLSVLAIAFAAYGCYRFLLVAFDRRTPDKRRRHDARNVLRLAVGIAGTMAVLGVVTQQ